MTLPNTQWKIKPPLPDEVSQNLAAYSPVFRQILYNRGITAQAQAEAFLNAEMPDTGGIKLLGIQPAVARIRQAIENGEIIAIYGDYDADGVTSTALLIHTLQALNAKVEPYIPDRFTEGYGLKTAALDMLKAKGIGLVITVDCGIRALHEAAHAQKIGLDLIITDHHHPAGEIPPAVAVINPKQPNDPYPNKNLAGVGVAYKLACALIEELEPENLVPENLLDLVAIGTVADLMSLEGENRALVRQGLRQIQSPTRQGVASLIGVCGLTPGAIGASEIGFAIGPRLNAAGRIASAMDALNLLTTQDVFQAGVYAQVLDNRNRERQRITLEIQEQVEQMANLDDPETFLLFAYHPNFNPGVVGLAASRLVELYYRPAVVGHQGEEYSRFSCRSIPEFHITKALEACAEADPDMFTQFGGHAAAAGFTVRNEKLSKLAKLLNQLAREQLPSTDLQPVLVADAAVKLIDLKPDLLREMARLQPLGPDNPEPVFISRGVEVKNVRGVGKEEAHLKLVLSDGRVTYDGIAFRQGHHIGELPEKIDIAFTYELNEFNGRTTIQLNIKDIQYR